MIGDFDYYVVRGVDYVIGICFDVVEVIEEVEVDFDFDFI